MIICTHDPPYPDALVVIYAADTSLLGRRHELGSSTAVITVGRHAENTIMIDSQAVSRRHARFERRADGWWVVDNGSANGTFLNEERVPEALLGFGDKVRIGDMIFKLDCTACQRALDDRRYTSTIFDGLTKAYNRRYLLEQLDSALQRTESLGPPLTLVMFDLDHFKKINDSCGHYAGDQVLREVASLTRKHVRPDDVFARYGGEEFALMLPATDLQGAAALTETIRAAIAAHVVTFEEHTISVTASAGVAQADEKTRFADAFIRSADEKLYQAKRGGRNRVVV